MVNVYFICSNQRSGTHLISNIIMNSYKNSLYKNDCGINVNEILYGASYSFIHYKYNKRYRDTNYKSIKRINLNSYDAIVFSAENSSILDFIDKSLQNFKKELNITNLYLIQNIRNPKNIIASSLKNGWTTTHIQNILNNQYNFLKLYKKQTDIVITIYDKLVTDKNYLQNLSSQLNLNYEQSLKALNHIDGYGNGSSFGKFQKEPAENYNNRFQLYLNNEKFLKLNNDEHNALFEDIFREERPVS